MIRCADGERAAETNTPQDQHDNASQVAEDGERKCAEKHGPLLPQTGKEKIAEKGREHEQGEKRTNAAARIGDIDLESGAEEYAPYSDELPAWM